MYDMYDLRLRLRRAIYGRANLHVPHRNEPQIASSMKSYAEEGETQCQ
jgi:hypothetical protein